MEDMAFCWLSLFWISDISNGWSLRNHVPFHACVKKVTKFPFLPPAPFFSYIPFILNSCHFTTYISILKFYLNMTTDNKLNSYRYAGANCTLPSTKSLPIIWVIYNRSGVHSHNIRSYGRCREDGRGLCRALAIPTPSEKESPPPYQLFGSTPVCFWSFVMFYSLFFIFLKYQSLSGRLLSPFTSILQQSIFTN